MIAISGLTTGMLSISAYLLVRMTAATHPRAVRPPSSLHQVC
jgi:hypothetical protein